MARIVADRTGSRRPDHDNRVALEPVLLALALIVVAAIVAAGCDTFFTIDVTVTDCGTQAPLAEVTAVLHLVDGFGEEDHTGITGEDGKLHIVMNEPAGVTATLTLTKTGYQTWSHQYQGNPDGPLAICMDPIGP